MGLTGATHYYVIHNIEGIIGSVIIAIRAFACGFSAFFHPSFGAQVTTRGVVGVSPTSSRKVASGLWHGDKNTGNKKHKSKKVLQNYKRQIWTMLDREGYRNTLGRRCHSPQRR